MSVVQQPYYSVSSEEELKNKVARDFFSLYDCTRILGRIDFSVYPKVSRSEEYVGLEITPFLWAEAKRDPQDILKAVTQLIITVGQQRTFDKHLPPRFLGAFDSEKIIFIPYNEVHDIFYMNDFDWTVRPSDHHTKEFKLVYDRVTQILDGKTLLFYYSTEEDALKTFIKENFRLDRTSGSRVRVDRNNFIIIYQRWLEHVKPTIAVDWLRAKEAGILDGDFYLADLLSKDDTTILTNLSVVLKKDHYEILKKIDEAGFIDAKQAFFKDNKKKYYEFWSKYERPPAEEYFDYIIQRRDLLVPQDVRERKGSFFTPKEWVELSQEYLARAFGEDWQDKYYVWDCAAGTGNLLNGLINKYNIWCSTLDQQDIDTIKQRIQNGANLLEAHVFQFDFLNDEWKPRSQGGKIPDNLYEIITDPEKQKQLIIYINPPYAEAGSPKTMYGTGTHKAGVSNQNKAHTKFKSLIGKASMELFALFMAQIYYRTPNCKIGIFSKPKFIQGPNFEKFRNFFLAEYKGGFIVPAWTFDNVTGRFGITFTIWDCSSKVKITQVMCDVYNEKAELIGHKNFQEHKKDRINTWAFKYKINKDPNQFNCMGYINCNSSDFQNQSTIRIQNKRAKGGGTSVILFPDNVVVFSIYFAVRHCIRANWLNDRDQFYYPDDGWRNDREFIADSVIFTIFHSQNRISTRDGHNHWIPFTELMVGAKARYRHHTMIDILEGRIGFNSSIVEVEPFRILDYLSAEAKEVYEAGLALWRYYHSQKEANPDASLYDIKAYFKGRTPEGKMKSKSDDPVFNELMNNLKIAMNKLALRIANKAYEYGFLRK